MESCSCHFSREESRKSRNPSKPLGAGPSLLTHDTIKYLMDIVSSILIGQMMTRGKQGYRYITVNLINP